jgi:DNA-binding MarR family transcriptional regulator
MHVEDSIGYWLVSATRSFASALAEVLRVHCVKLGKPYEITPTQWAVIMGLSAHDGQTIGALAQRLGVDGPAATNLVKRLEQGGLVKRSRSREDERVVEVWLTAEGQDLFRSLDPVVERFQEEILPTDQRQRLIESLQYFIARVSVVAPDAGDRFSSLQEYVRRQIFGSETGSSPESEQ